MIRIGSGFDVHRLKAGRPLILGGVEIPFDKGLVGHSDADVLSHAICDSIFGAAAIGDIGMHFSDSDARYLDADSLGFIRQAVAMVAGRGLVPHNVDTVVIAERPKLALHAAAIKKNLAIALGLPEDAVGVKATTSEGLGFTGRGEGIAAQAVCTLLEKQP